MAANDGSGAREVSKDVVDAESPVITPDANWIVYSSANPPEAGTLEDSSRWFGRSDYAARILRLTFQPSVVPEIYFSNSAPG